MKENKENESGKNSLSAGENNSKPMTAEEVLEDLGEKFKEIEQQESD